MFERFSDEPNPKDLPRLRWSEIALPDPNGLAESAGAVRPRSQPVRTSFTQDPLAAKGVADYANRQSRRGPPAVPS